MMTKSLVAALVLAFWCVLSTSCLQAIPDGTAPQPSTSTAPPASALVEMRGAEPIEINNDGTPFSGNDPDAGSSIWGREPTMEPTGQASEPMGSLRNPWVFTVTRDYDGQNGAGGEQEATASIGFVAETVPPHYFACNVRVRMPVQTLKYGRITKKYAARVTLKVSDEAADSMDWREWGEPTNIYCRQYVEKMQRIFSERYVGIGARVTRSDASL